MMSAALHGWAPGVVALALLAMVLFGLAIRTGRWGIWLAGYLVVLLGVVAVTFGAGSRAGDPPTGTGSMVAPQPTASFGVLHAPSLGTRLLRDGRLRSGEVA
jgi:hypothetical protein